MMWNSHHSNINYVIWSKKNVNIKASIIVIDIDKFIKAKKEVKYLKVLFDFKMN